MLVKRKIENGKCVGAIIKHIGPKQNLTYRFMKRAMDEGWMSWDSDDVLKIHSDPPVYLRVDRFPGYYVVFDPETRFDTRDEAFTHRKAWGDIPSTDPGNPSGVMLLHIYECTNMNHDGRITKVEQEKDFVDKFLDFLVGE